MIPNENAVIKTYEKLIKRQQTLCDDLSNLDRQKEYEVQKVERYYNSKIDDKKRQLIAVSLQIKNTRLYVNDIARADNCSAVDKIMPKESDDEI